MLPTYEALHHPRDWYSKCDVSALHANSFGFVPPQALLACSWHPDRRTDHAPVVPLPIPVALLFACVEVVQGSCFERPLSAAFPSQDHEQ